MLLRGGLITAIYSRSLRLTSRARSTLTNGKLINHISTDVSRIDFCAGFAQLALTAPLQSMICLAILIATLGPNTLGGFALFLLMAPAQGMAMKTLLKIRRKSMAWTDKRVKLLQEILGGMKIIKLFVWENSYLQRVFGLRQREMA